LACADKNGILFFLEGDLKRFVTPSISAMLCRHCFCESLQTLMRGREHEVALFVLDETRHDICVVHQFWAPDGHFKASIRFWGARQPHMLDVVVGSKVGNQSTVPCDRC
jgi:hypothetical protein